MMKKTIIMVLVIVLALTACGKIGENSKAYNKKGLNYYSEGMYKEAAENFKKAVESNDLKAEYYLNYGMTLIELLEYDEAIVQFDKAIVLKDTQITRENNKKAYRGKGIAYLMKKEYALSIEQFDMALEIEDIKEINKDILLYKAEAQTKSKDYENAIITYTSIIEKKSTDSVPYTLRANIYAMQDNIEMAVSDLDLAIANNKNDYNLYLSKYFLLLNSNESDKASEVLNSALKIKPKDKDDNLLIAKIHFYQGDYENAFIELSVAKESGFIEAIFYLGQLYEKRGETEKAIELYKEYLSNEKILEGSMAYYKLGLLYLNKEDYKEAQDCFSKGIELNQGIIERELRFNEIIAYEKLTDYKNAYKKLVSYVKEYADDENAKRELEFLKTRID